MAGAGYKLFNTGDVLTAAQVNTYLQEQVVMVFASATARTTALTGVLAEGMMSYLQDTNAVEVYDGSAWVSVGSTGDITAVNVSSPITGGGTSGAVTISIQDGTTAQKGAVQLEDSTSSTSTTKAATPNSVKSAYDLANAAIAKSLVDAAGDLIYATADNTVARLALGTAGQVLTVNSGATAPEWKTASSGSTFVGASVYKTAAQSISNNTNTALTFTNENFDTDGIHSNTTNTSRFTIPTGKGGKWLFTAAVTFAGNATGYRQITIQKNASVNSEVYNLVTTVGSGSPSMGISFIADAVATDYFELYCKQNSGGALNVEGDASFPNYTVFQCVYLGA